MHKQLSVTSQRLHYRISLQLCLAVLTWLLTGIMLTDVTLNHICFVCNIIGTSVKKTDIMQHTSSVNDDCRKVSVCYIYVF